MGECPIFEGTLEGPGIYIYIDDVATAVNELFCCSVHIPFVIILYRCIIKVMNIQQHEY